MKKLLMLFIVSFTFFALAEELPPTGVVVKLHGNIFFEGKKIKQGDLINKVGKIETKEKSYLQIKIEKWKNTISIGPKSIMELNFSDEKKYTLAEGSCRWKSNTAGESKGKIFTKNVAMGVRGTDFLLTVNPILNESEIIMFEGVVLMENLNDKTNTALIKKGQWGGIGGRFGQKISPILNLPQTILDSASKQLE